MSSCQKNIAVHVEGLSKCYKLYPRPVDMLFEYLSKKKRHSEHWALSDVSFEIPRGEVVGILGRNGAGKSTLLKILAGTLDSTSGSVSVNGKLSAVLELGTGFHPEYTGRENIVMGGMCIGMSRKEVTRKIDEIIDFSELEDVIDQPFKTYSSGMQGRLTFSTAMCVEPDIFIVDEALATGDALFQEKCMSKIKDICSGGTTVLLVTHSLAHIYEVCTSCMLFESGRLVCSGDTFSVGKQYESLLYGNKRVSLERINNEEDAASDGGQLQAEKYSSGVLDSGNGLELLDITLQDHNGHNVRRLRHGDEYIITSIVRAKEDKKNINIGFKIQRDTGLAITGDTTYENGMHISINKGETVSVQFRFKLDLAPGNYLLGGGGTEILNETVIPCIHKKAVVVFIVEGRELNGLVNPCSKIMVNRMGC